MAVTDLTGTTWAWDENANFDTLTPVYQAEFHDANGNSYVSFSAYYSLIYSQGQTGITVYNPFATPKWVDEAYRTITFDSNPSEEVASFVESHASLVEEEDEPSNTISIGNLPIANMYFGTQQVKKVYLGNTLVWRKEEEPIPENALLVQDGALLTSDGGYLITTEVTMISFMINDNSYQAEEGMTWMDWVANPTYNTGVGGAYFGVDGRKIRAPNGSYVLDGTNAVLITDIIVANTTYAYTNYGGGGSD